LALLHQPDGYVLDRNFRGSGNSFGSLSLTGIAACGKNEHIILFYEIPASRVGGRQLQNLNPYLLEKEAHPTYAWNPYTYPSPTLTIFRQSIAVGLLSTASKNKSGICSSFLKFSSS